MFPVRALPLSAALLVLTPPLDPLQAGEDLPVAVPLFDDGIMIRVPVNAFGQTLYFLVDTGFTLSAIDARFVRFLGKPVSTCVAENPFGVGSSLPVYHSPEIVLAGKTLGLDGIACLDLTLARKISGQACDGILGMDFFASRVVSIDFDQGLLSMDVRVPGWVTNTFVAVPLTCQNRHYTAEVRVNQTQAFDLLIDTGDNSSLSFNPAAWQELFSSNRIQTARATLAGVDNPGTQSQMGLIECLTVGGFNYTNLHATLIRNPADPSHLGLGFFRRHRVVFDFPGRKLYLQPGRQFFLPDQEDMSGLHLLQEGRSAVVYSVDENSPAFAAGIEAQDVIAAINGQSASSLSLNEIRRTLQSKDGDRVVLLIQRGSRRLSFEFLLKQVI